MAEECASKSTCGRSSCDGCPSKKTDFTVDANKYTKVKHVIAIASGKGGVGKSTVTANLAVELARQGYQVGIMDADITGPSIPHMFGVEESIYAVMAEDGETQLMIPGESGSGIKMCSMNLLMDDVTQPVVWRGSMVSGVVKQFWSDVYWGELDYLLVDMPPGTGDVPLTVYQSLPIEGVIIVTSPQSLVDMVVKKAYNMAGLMNIPVLGIVENYSYVLCPDCGRKIFVFGEHKLDALSAETGVPVVAQLPMDPELAELADAGRVEDYFGVSFADVAAVLPKA